ncbi:unnamed protein product [Closterium sp. NIES-53]
MMLLGACTQAETKNSRTRAWISHGLALNFTKEEAAQDFRKIDPRHLGVGLRHLGVGLRHLRIDLAAAAAEGSTSTVTLYFQCGLRTSHACPARRTVDLSCWDPSVPLCLNYHSTHSHTPHYPAAGAGATATNTSPAPLPKVRSVKDRSVRARGSAPVTAAAAAGAAGAAAVDRSPLSKRAAVKEEATETNGGAGRTLQCPPSCLPALASTPVSGATWKDTSVPAPSRPSSNACSPSPHAPASAVADWRAALEALLNGSALPASAPTPAPASSDEPAHARPSTVPSSGSCAAAAAAPLQAQLQPLPVDLLAALVLLVQSALAEGGLAGAEEAVPTAEGMPRQQQQHEQQQQQQQHEQQQQQQHEQLQQQHEQQEELPGLEDTDCPLSSAPLTPALSDPTNCPQQSFGTSENTDDAEFFQEMSPGGDDTAADALAAAAESHLVNWEESGDAGADLLGDSLTWPSDSWPNASQLLALEHCMNTAAEPFVTEEELKLMLRGAEMSGAIEEEEQDMIENVLEIKDTYVREVMTPLVDVVAVGSSASLMELRALWVRHQYSRVPVYERRVDNIVGIAYAMDMLDYVEQPELLHRLSVGRIAHRPAYFVPDSMSVWNLLREFRIRKVHMAIVLNEYGGTVGLVTLEDAVEEIVGEIFDENDSKRAEGVDDVDAKTTGMCVTFENSQKPHLLCLCVRLSLPRVCHQEEIRRKTGYIIQRAEGVYDVDANTTVDDLADILQVVLPPVSVLLPTTDVSLPHVSPSSPRQPPLLLSCCQRASFYETVSGFVCEAFGYIPRTGDTKIIRLQRKESEEEEEGEGAEEGGAGGTFTLPALLPLILSPGWQILSGNARKVVAVRFEELKETEGASGGGVKGKLGAGKEEEDIEKETERKREKDRERALVEEWESEKRREGRRKERISQEVRSRGLGEVGRGEGEGTGEGESKCETCEQMKLGRGKAGGRGVLLDSESEGEEGEVLMGGGWLTSGDGEEGGYSEVVYTDSDMGERDGVGESGSDMGSGTEIEGESVRRGEGGEFDGVESGGVGGEEEEDQDLFGEELEGADERRVGELRGVLHQEQQQAASAGADGPGTERGEAGAGTTTSYSTSSSSSMMSSSSSMITTGSTGVECDSPGSSNGSSLVRGAAWREEAVTWRTEEEEEDSDYSSGSDGLVGLNGGAGGKGGGVREFEGVAMAQEQYERWEEKEKQVERRRQRRKRERSEAQAELRRQALGIGGGGDAATQLSPHTEPLRLRLSRPDAVSESERE